MRGVAVLTEGSSGADWLRSLTNATGLMGRSEEWVDPAYLGFVPASYDALEVAVFKKASTDNGRFAIELFPRHLLWCREKFGKDFLFEIRRKHGLGFIVLERRDRLRQAISFYRAGMSGTSHEGNINPRTVPYNFADISQAYFQISRSYAFCRSYLRMSGLDFRQFVYEDLQPNPTPYLRAVSDFMEVAAPQATPGSKFIIRREDVTEDWIARFREDAATKGAIGGIGELPVPRTFDNLARFVLKRPLIRKRF